MEEVAKEYINYARQFTSTNSLSKAFDMYMLAFEKCPAIKNRYEPEFRNVIIQLNEMLAEDDRMEDLFNNFGKSIRMFPTNIHLLNDIGKYLYKFGFYSEAWNHFHDAIFLDTGTVNAEKNLNSVKNLLVDRWQYRLLNDKIRNETYRQAIHDTLKPFKDTVLDLGTGTGILSMFAHELKPIAVTAVDTSEAMTQLAECVTQGSGILDIVILNNVPTTMNFLDIGGKRSLLITEMFDAGLFGEQILQTLTHAWENFISNVGRILPKRAEFFVVGVKSDDLIRKYQLQSSTKTLLNIPNLNVHILNHNETYDSEDVHLYKDLVYMTDTKSLVKVDFNNPDDLMEKLKRTEPYEVEFRTKEKGEINAVIGWFNLYLSDKISLTTNPRSPKRSNAWQQAVFFDNIPRHVKENETIKLDFFMNAGKLTLGKDSNSHIVRISPEILRFLNDAEFINAVMGCIGMASVYLGQMTDMSQISIADLSPFPLFGLQMLKRGAQSLICVAKTLSDKRFFKKVFRANKVSLSKVNILVGDEWDQEVFGEDKYHAIVGNFLDLCGDIDLRMKEICLHLKHLHLLPGGLYMPAEIRMIAQVIRSHWVDINNKVYDENVCDFKVATHLNRFSISQNFCIDFGLLEYEALTDPVAVGTCSEEMVTDSALVVVKKGGEANAVLCWYSIELMEDLCEISTGRGDSFIDGLLYLPPKNVNLESGEEIKLLRSTDVEGAFKVTIEPPVPPPAAPKEPEESADAMDEAAALPTAAAAAAV